MNKDYLKHFVKNSVFILFLLSPIIELVDGFLTMRLHVSYFGQLINVMFLILPILLILYLPLDRGIIFICFFSFILFHMFLRLAHFGVKIEEIMFDFQYTARSVLVMFSILLLVYTLQMNKASVLFNKFFLIQWIVITTSILLHVTVGIGYQRYVKDSAGMLIKGYLSYFQSGNQLAFFYTTSWWVFASSILGVLKSRFLKMFLRILLTFLTLAVLFAMGTKTGVALVLAMCGLFILKKIYDTSKIFFGIACIGMLTFLVFLFINPEYFLNLIVQVFTTFSSRAKNIAQKVNVYGAFTALVSQRNFLVLNALKAISKYDIKDILVGPDFYSYEKAVGSYIDSHEIRMAEVDPLDLLGGFGVIGVLTIYIPILWIFAQLLKNWRFAIANSEHLGNNNLPVSVLGVITLAILNSSMSGHVTVAPAPMMCLGLTLAVGWHLTRHRSFGYCKQLHITT